MGSASYPVVVFVLLSAVFGIGLVAAAPPLRGPDETAHFLRAYGIAQGDLMPSVQDAAHRKGILLPGPFYRDFALFEKWQTSDRGEEFSYRRVFAEYWAQPEASEEEREPVFVPYAGSEGYSPAAYLPHAAMAWLARAAGLGFLATFYLMRLAGLAAMTAVVAYAIARTPLPSLSWTFLAIGMLPSALNGRAVINADAAAFAYSLVLVGLFLRRSSGLAGAAPPTRAVWTLLCALSKPPNIAFALLEWFHPVSPGWPKWRDRAMVILPALVATVVWTAASSADVAAWRLVEITGAAPEEFAPAWKLRFMVDHPGHFLEAVGGSFLKKDPAQFWHQVIGVLGLFDTVLRPWVYTGIGGLLAATSVSAIGGGVRPREGLAALLVGAAYCFAVVLIFYLVWTPINADEIWGVQGRYFVPVLPLVAVVVATLFRRAPNVRITALLAVAAALLAGAGSIDAVLRTDWNY
jgi:uncharacterized membrane protein